MINTKTNPRGGIYYLPENVFNEIVALVQGRKSEITVCFFKNLPRIAIIKFYKNKLGQLTD